MHELKLYDVLDGETQRTLLTIQARGIIEASSRVPIAIDLADLPMPDVNVTVVEHPEHTMVITHYFSDKFFDIHKVPIHDMH